MKTVALFALLLAFAGGGYIAGRLRDNQSTRPDAAGKAGRILYYVDPMNPAHTSDRPGLAPCGMKLEPVYADTTPMSQDHGGSQDLVPGTVRISPERQQLAGIQVALVEKKALPHSLRLPGRVALDEARLYRINASVNGWISRTLPCSTGDPVKKDEVLAELNSPELLPAVQSLLFTLNTRNERVDEPELATSSPASVFRTDLTYLQGLGTLRHLGMGERQLDDLVKNRKFVKSIAIVSPVDGVLTGRNVSDEFHVEKGHELFRVADLSHIWIMADISGWEGEHVMPGSQVLVSVPRQTKTFVAKVSKSLPLFDNASQTLKLRLEMENSDFALRPDMLVDVELPVELPEMILVNADGVIDTGRKQSVFVDTGGGVFQPRQVKTGRRLGEHVEIVQGLTPGERIVTSGNFLLDSESRMKMSAALALAARNTKDPVCGMTVDEQEVRAAGQFSVYQGRTYYFCNPGCKRSFDAGPSKFLKAPSHPGMETADLTAAAGDHQKLP